MDGLSKFLELAAAIQQDPDGPGYTIPIAFLVDSLMSTLPDKGLEKIRKEGHATLGYPVAARLIADYMRSMPKWLQNFPFTIIGTNHLKVGQDAMGRPTTTSPGGSSVKFMETYEIQMKKAHNPDIDKVEYGGLRVNLKTSKNSLGPSRKQIVAELLWWREEGPDGMIRQATQWDWYTASVDLLLAFNEDRSGFNVTGKKTIYKRLMEICHIVVTNKARREAKCKILGINEPVEFREIGLELEKHPEILAELYPVLGIAERAAFGPGLDYQQIRRELAVQAEAQAAAAAEASARVVRESQSEVGVAQEALALARAERLGETDELVDEAGPGNGGTD